MANRNKDEGEKQLGWQGFQFTVKIVNLESS